MTESPTLAEASPSEQQVRAEMARMLFRAVPTLYAGHFLLIALLVALLWPFVPRIMLLSWTGLAILVNVLRIAVALHFGRRAADDKASLRCARGFAGLSGAAGAVWGAAGLLFFVPEAPLTVVATMLALLSHVGTSVAALALYPPAYFALALPSVLPITLRALAQGDVHSLGVALFMVALSLSGLMHYRRVNRTANESVRLRCSNIALVEWVAVETERAEAANRAKSRFLATASHDLRQPTHAMGLFIATLRMLAQRSRIEQAELRSIAQRVHAAAQTIGRLLGDVLDIASLDAGGIEARKRHVALQQVLGEIFNEFVGTAKSEGIVLEVMPTSLWADTDPVLLRRILSNLTSSALRYSRRGRVVIGCRRRGDRIAVQVHDTGLGIPSDQLSASFRGLSTIGERGAAGRAEQALGLGLAIVQRSAALLLARTEFTSRPGRGSVFTIVLPRVFPATAARPGVAEPGMHAG